MGAITNQVGKAWDIALAAMWDIQENMLKVSTKAQTLALLALDASTSRAKEDKATQMSQDKPPEATYANKETQISMEDNLEQRQVCRTTHMMLKDNPMEK